MAKRLQLLTLKILNLKNKEMKKMKYCVTYLMIWMSVPFTGCTDMDENYKQYTNEYDYSGKISNLRSYIGNERVILAWDNPNDQKSKTILIEYGIDKKQKTFESLVDSVVIDKLDSGVGYMFDVFTQDAFGNMSVPVSKTVLPISKKTIALLEPPTCFSEVSDDNFAITWNNLSTITMHFNGKMSYSISGSDGFSKDAKFDLEIKREDSAISSYTLPISELKAGITYKVGYTIEVWPIAGNTVTYDLISLTGEATITME